MRRIHALITETTADFKNFFKTADDCLFEISFRRDTQKNINVQGVIMGGKGFGHGAGSRIGQNRRFNFNKTFVPVKLPQGFDKFAAKQKTIKRLPVAC